VWAFRIHSRFAMSGLLLNEVRDADFKEKMRADTILHRALSSQHVESPHNHHHQKDESCSRPIDSSFAKPTTN